MEFSPCSVQWGMIASALAFSSGQHSPSQVKYHRGSSVAIYLTLLLRHRSEGVHIPVLLTKVVWHAIAAGTLDTSQLCVMADLRFPSFLGHTFSSFINFFSFCNVTNLSLLLSAMSVIDSRAYYSRFQSSQGQIILGWPQILEILPSLTSDSYQVLRLNLTKSYFL